MVSDDAERLRRLLKVRREEEERARLREAEALREVETLRNRVHCLRAQVRACRAGDHSGSGGADALIDAHHCAARLRRRLQAQADALERAEARLAEARREVAGAGRRRLAVERLASGRALHRDSRRRKAAQAELDESGRLRALREEDVRC